MIHEGTVIRGLMGSRSVGTDTAASDVDYMEVVLGSEDVYLGMDYWGSQGTKESKSTLPGTDTLVETTAYELIKFLRLCQGFNPNVIPLLWLLPQHYEILTPAGQLIVENRHLFNSKIAVASFCGYAHNQLKKMGVDGAATGRMGAARKALRDTFGFDTKYAYHTIRLSRMLKEFLQSDGMVLNVYRWGIDHEELLAIREGAFTYDQIMVRATELLAEVEELAKGSSLPDKPNKAGIRLLCKDILRQHLGLR